MLQGFATALKSESVAGSAALPGLPTSVQLLVTREASSDAIACVAQLIIRGTKIRII